MSEEETLEARQNYELEALKAIYADDLKDLRTKSAWNKWKPLNLSITLTPQQGSSGLQEIHVTVDLHVQCSEYYPNKIPIICLENSRGLSTATLEKLKNELELKAENLKGEEMIFQLAQLVQEFLHSHNKPGFKSFYEEMLTRQKEEEQRSKQAKQLERDREKQVILEEIHRRQEILKSENRKRKEHRFNSDNSENDDDNRKSNGYSESSDENLCDHKGVAVIEFLNNGYREIQRGSCIGHLPHCTIFSGIDKESGKVVVVSEWNIPIKSEIDLAYVQKQVSSIEQELNYLVKLKHYNLAHYLNIKHSYCLTDNKIVVYILREFVFGTNCSSFFLCESIRVDTEYMRHIARGVLNALDYLHRNNVVHKEINQSHIYINDKGVVKVSNYSIDKRLSDLISQPHIPTIYNKKTDILKFGLLIMSLVTGTFVSEEEIEVPKNLSEDLYDFLNKCLAKQEKERFTASQLLNHLFLRPSIERFSPKRVIDKDLLERHISPENPTIDVNSSINASGQSRINTEFEFLQHLGKGAYGDVIKVQNKLDGRFYAIKRIELNPKNKQLNRKIVREVKLLSRLNHENVVRYYNSWIETAVIENECSDESSRSVSVDLVQIPKVINKKELTFKDDIEALAPPIKSWSVSFDGKSQGQNIDSSSSDDSSDDQLFCQVINPEDSSDSESIQFGESSAAESPTKNDADLSTKRFDTNNSPLSRCTVREIQFMYIQMEFCEKSTLRTAIDDGLYLEEDRIWRLFREIVEGLTHIHQQGMIHRDLKPVNIFLDSNDHVKIGDFGLATTNMRSRHSDFYSTSKSLFESEKDDINCSLTGHVGTALYVAPELSATSKAVYNQKVDIYSLGIILFEMCYKSSTGMERIKVLTGIRSNDVILPSDFSPKDRERKEYLIRWLLNHDTSKRPTSQELLQSEHIPPPVLAERQLQELVRHTLSNPQLKGYKYLVASCFKQRVTAAQDITFDKEPSAPNFLKSLNLYDFVKQATMKVFKLHGGQSISTPLLMPKSKYYEDVESCVKLMTHSGNVVLIPHDLRVPFARYAAWNSITLLRRYSIERVYREKKVFGFIPRELYECAFDIVTPNPGNFMVDAEVLYIVNEIINDLPGLKNKNFTIRLNHTSLIKAILLHFGIKDKHEEIYKLLSEPDSRERTKKMEMYFISFGLSDNSLATILNLLNSEFEITKAISSLQTVTKRKSGEASLLAKQALQELKMIIQNIEAFGVDFEIVIVPGLVYNMQQYSGMICQVVCELKKHKRGTIEVLAAGGRYDSMISSFRNIMEKANMLGKDIQQSAVGISISLDKLVQAVQEEGSNLADTEYLDVAVCSIGTKPQLKEKAKILRSLWAAGIRSSLIEASNVEEIQEQCNELKVPHVIMLKDTEQGSVRVRSWERDRFQEKTFTTTDLIDNMLRVVKSWNDNSYEISTVNNTLAKSESKMMCNDHHDANISVLFVTAEKMSYNARKRFENQIRSQMDTICKRLNGDVIIFGLSIETNIIRTLSAYLDFDNEQQFARSVESVIERHQRHRRYLIEICDEIYEQKMKRTSPLIILYSLPDSFHKLLV